MNQATRSAIGDLETEENGEPGPWVVGGGTLADMEVRRYTGSTL